MILILTDDKISLTVEKVIDWLDSKLIEYERINGNEFLFDNKSMSIHTGDITNGNVVVWFWGFFDNKKVLETLLEDLHTDNYNIALLSSRVSIEARKISSAFIESFDYTLFPSNSLENHNKFKTIGKAKRIGLTIPESTITNNKIDLLNFSKQRSIITKSF